MGKGAVAEAVTRLRSRSCDCVTAVLPGLTCSGVVCTVTKATRREVQAR
jgi:hypothetical protein